MIVKVASCCYRIRPIRSLNEFKGRVLEKVALASSRGADFLLLPELHSSELAYLDARATFPDSWRSTTAYFDEIDDLLAAASREHDMHIVGGSYLRRDARSGGEERIYNTATLYAPSGERKRYDKVHLFPLEVNAGISDSRRVPLFTTRFGPVGVQICFDIQFPFPTCALVKSGAEIIFCPAFTLGEAGFLRVRRCAQARAIENDCYVVVSHTLGADPTLGAPEEGFGRAAVLGPCDRSFSRDGILAQGEVNSEDLVVTALDLQRLRHFRETAESSHHGKGKECTYDIT